MAKHEFRVASSADVYTVVNDPAESTDEDIKAAGLSRWQAVKVACSWLGKHAHALYEDGEVMCVFGHNAHVGQRRARVTWFLCRPGLWEMGARGVRLLRRHIANQARQWPGTVFYAYNYSKHPQVDRWFNLLGFIVCYEDGFKVFKLLPESKRDDTAPVVC